MKGVCSIAIPVSMVWCGGAYLGMILISSSTLVPIATSTANNGKW